jgi:hypothetical protein
MKRAAAPLERLSKVPCASGTESALGIEARSRAQVIQDDAAERLYPRRSSGSAGPTVRVELAAGDRARVTCGRGREDLLAQEAQIAQLTRDGLPNPEIGAPLFISSRTGVPPPQGVREDRYQRAHRTRANAAPGSGDLVARLRRSRS